MNTKTLLAFMRRIPENGSEQKSAMSLGQLADILKMQNADPDMISPVDSALRDIPKDLFNGAAVPDKDMLKEIVHSVSYRDIFVFNCMLLKGFIDSREKVHRFLDFSIDVGVPKIGFMVCGPINKLAEDHRILYEDVISEDDPSLLFARGFYDYEFCHCRDGVYVSQSGDIIEFYGRDTNTDNCKYCRGPVYEADDHLRDDFGGKIII